LKKEKKVNRAEKQEFVTNFGSLLNNTNFVLIAHYKGLSVSEISSLREQVKDKKALFKVAKNSLAKRAIMDTSYEMLKDFFVGPTAVTISDDPVSAAKVIYDFSKENENLKIIAAAMGDKELSIEEIKHLASLPSMEALRAKIVGLLQAPMSGIVSILNEPSTKVVRLLNAKNN
jgi:large subunit ribosomal protein L10